MASPPEPDLMEARRHLAGLIDAALEVGQRGDGRSAAWWRPWGNVRFADKVFAAEAAVRSWRNRDNPSRPRNIVPLLKVLYGDVPKFAEAKKAMQDAWRAAGGLSETEPPPLPPQTIDAQDFIDVARIVDLSVFQPMPDNADDNQFLPFRLIISPDRRCEIAGKKIEIGVSEALVMIQSDHWQPCRESVFSSKTHTNVHKDATPNGFT